MKDFFGVLYSAKHGPVAIAEFSEREPEGDEVYFNGEPIVIAGLVSPGSHFLASIEGAGAWLEHYDDRAYFDVHERFLLRGFFQLVDKFPSFEISGATGVSVEVADIEAVLVIDHNLQGAPEYWREEHEILSATIFESADGNVLENHFPRMREALQKASQKLDELEIRCKAAGLGDNLNSWMTADEMVHSLTICGQSLGFKRSEIMASLGKFISSGAAAGESFMSRLTSKKGDAGRIAIFDLPEG